MSYRDDVLALSPLAYRRLGEAVDAPTAVDEVGSFDGTYVGPPTLGVAGALGASGDDDTAVYFSDASRHITHSDIALTGAFTWMAWVKQTWDATSRLWVQCGAGNNRWGSNASKLFVRLLNGGSSDNTVSPPTDDVYHFICLRRDASNVCHWFIDGVKSAALFGGAAQVGTVTLTHISTAVGTGDKTLDEEAVFGSALSDAQIAALYTAGTTVPNAAPVFGQDLGNRSDAEGAVISLSAAATDANDDELTYSATGLPTGLSINASTGLISGTISAGAAASSPYSVEVSVTDGIADPVTDTFTWTVTAPEPEPEANGPTGALKAWRSW